MTSGFCAGSRNFRKLHSVCWDVFCFARVRLYPLSGSILYWVSVIVSRFTSFTEDFMIRRYHVTKLFSARGRASPCRLLQRALVVLVFCFLEMVSKLLQPLWEVSQAVSRCLFDRPYFLHWFWDYSGSHQFPGTSSSLRKLAGLKEVLDESCRNDAEDELESWWLLTAGPLVWITVLFAEFSKR